MITNKPITYYKKGLDANKLEKWTKYVFNKVWIFSGKGSHINKGYENANDMDVRIPIQYVRDKSLFHIGDIVAVGIQGDIEKKQDLQGKEFYSITSVNINDFGNNPHVHLGGK